MARQTEASHVAVRYRSRDAVRLLLGLLGLEVFLAIAHILLWVIWPNAPVSFVRFLLSLDEEVALGTWFATVQLFVIGGVLLFASWINKDDRSLNPVLLSGGLLFVFLSADEGARIHERITFFMREHDVEVLNPFPGEHGAWILVYAALALLLLPMVGFYLRNPLRRIWKRFGWESIVFLGGFATIIVGAVGFEILSYLFLRSESSPDFLYHLEVAIEELLEMAGASVILYATLEISAPLCSER
jgi:hypothetical protein